MKAVVNQVPVTDPTLTFPRLMVDRKDGEVLLFVSRNEAITLATGSSTSGQHYSVGQLSNRALELYQDFTGSVTLSN